MPTSKVPVKVAKAITTDEVLLSNCDEAALRYREAWYDFARALHAVRVKQAYHSRGFTSFRDYIDKSFTFKLRKAELQVRTIAAFMDAGVDVEKVDKSKAYTLSRVLTRHNAAELIEFSKDATHQEVANRVAEIAGSVQKYHLGFVFNDPDDFAHAEKVLDYSATKEATLSRTVALIAIFDEWWSNHSEGADVDLENSKRPYPMSDPVSEEVISRDGRCMNTNCGSKKNLERHSVDRSHSKALPVHCTTLCRVCHDQVTNSRSTVMLINPERFPGVITYKLKDGGGE
jgi:hypothetical protein